MKRTINKVAVLGSGVMGSRIACHFAGAGIPVLLLDIAPTELNATEQAKKLSLQDKAVKNRVVNQALSAALKSNPSPVYTTAVIEHIITGNFTDDLPGIGACDWVIEVVVENLEIKQTLFNEVEKYRKPGTLVTSNTSGIPIHLMAAGRSTDFKAHFCGTHFFNPPRYLRLVEIIPTADTLKEVVNFLLHFSNLFLGKTAVLAKDAPAFIANRIGVFSMLFIFKLMEKYNLSINEVDFLTGPLIGHPKSATFRTADVVGIDTLVKVANGVAKSCPNDEQREVFTIPAWLQKMVEQNWIGDKSGQGFYKKLAQKTDRGETIIEVLNLQTFQYEPKQKVRFAEYDIARQTEDFIYRMQQLLATKTNAGNFLKQLHYGLFAYVSYRIPEITDHLYRVDEAMTAGFGWEAGPFTIWDALGVANTVNEMEQMNLTAAPWVKEMLQQGHQSFYKVENERRLFYDISTKRYLTIEGLDQVIVSLEF